MPDISPLDPATDVGKVRLLTSDSQVRADPLNPTADPEYYFSDAFITGFLAINSGNLKLAAADILSAFATNVALLDKKIRKENLQTDGPAVANALRLLASDYRVQGNHARDNEDATDGTFVIVDFEDPVTPFDAFEYLNGGPLWH